jgi:hypothetical protein
MKYKSVETVSDATSLVLMLVIISLPRCRQNRIKLLERILARHVGCCVIHQLTNISFPVNIVEMSLVLISY